MCRASQDADQGIGLRIGLPAIPDPAPVVDALRVVVRPVYEPAKLVPLIHPPHLDAITDAEWHAICEVEIMGDQQCPAIADIDNEALVAGAIVVIV